MSVETPFQPFVPPAGAPEPPRRASKPRTAKPEKPGKKLPAASALPQGMFTIGAIVDACSVLKTTEELQTLGMFAIPWAKLTPEARGRIVAALDVLFKRS